MRINPVQVSCFRDDFVCYLQFTFITYRSMFVTAWLAFLSAQQNIFAQRLSWTIRHCAATKLVSQSSLKKIFSLNLFIFSSEFERRKSIRTKQMGLTSTFKADKVKHQFHWLLVPSIRSETVGQYKRWRLGKVDLRVNMWIKD